MAAPRAEWWHDHDTLISIARWMTEVGRLHTSCDKVIDFFEKPYVWGDAHDDYRVYQLLSELDEDDSLVWQARDDDGDIWNQRTQEFMHGCTCDCGSRAAAFNSEINRFYCPDHLEEVLT